MPQKYDDLWVQDTSGVPFWTRLLCALQRHMVDHDAGASPGYAHYECMCGKYHGRIRDKR